ncbi:hypothetical protein SRHO_G00025910 [Serrasalmus rhombeus]
MDDLTVMTESVPDCRWILKGPEKLMKWVWMHFKPAKSRSMVLRKGGKVQEKFWFYMAGTAIPTITEKPVKSLHKVYDSSLKDSTSIQSTYAELDGWLKSMDKNTRGKERQRLVQEEVRAAVEEARSCKAVGMRHQGAWTRWLNAVERKVTWTGIWKAEPHRIKFLIQAVYDVLPSPSNLHTWGIAETPACPLCSKRGNQAHILSCCTTALGEGRYRWRHDQVLKTIAEAISTGLLQAKQFRPSKKTITWGASTPVKRSLAGILTTARDWQLLVDLERQLKFPSHIALTTLRPDIVLVSESTKQAALLEPKVPWEDHLEEAFERKLSK